MTGARVQPPALLGLAADDLTGATDSAVGFSEHGWRAELILRPNDPPSTMPPTDPTPTVLAISTEARAQSDADAARATFTAVDMLVRAGAQRLYLKIDSTIRGSIPGQLAGALQAWRQLHPDAAAVVCPAFPAQRRTVVGGSVLVDGIPVAQTAAGTDPVTPRAVSHLAAVIAGSTHGTLDQLGTEPVLVVDASTDAEPDAIAREGSAAGPSLIMVGSGGLAAALGRQWPVPATRPAGFPGAPALTVLVAVSSLHPVAIDQVDHLRRHLGCERLRGRRRCPARRPGRRRTRHFVVRSAGPGRRGRSGRHPAPRCRQPHRRGLHDQRRLPERHHRRRSGRPATSRHQGRRLRRSGDPDRHRPRSPRSHSSRVLHSPRPNHTSTNTEGSTMT